MSEGILTLERKDRQRESKTKLLLALKEDVVALRKELADERDLVAKLTAWIQTTLKPSLVQLRTESAASVESVRAELKLECEKLRASDDRLGHSITHNANAAELGLKEASERHDALQVLLQQTRSTVTAKFESFSKEMDHNFQNAAAVAAAATAASYERATRERKEQCEQIASQGQQRLAERTAELSEALIAQWRESLAQQQQWVGSEVQRFTREQEERIQQLSQSLHAERSAWQEQFVAQRARESAALNAALEAMRTENAASIAARAEAHRQWEQKKELWMSSFLKDVEASQTRIAQAQAQQWNQWRDQMERVSAEAKRQSEEAALSLAARLTLDLRDAKNGAEEARRVWEHAHEEKLAVQIGQIVDWQRTLAAAEKEWKAAVWDTITQWQERYGPVIRQFVANQKSQLEEEAGTLSASSRAAFPVPGWMQALLTECGMQRYGPLLCSHGFDNEPALLALDEGDLARMGASLPLGHGKAILMHVRAKKMAAGEHEERERQQREYEDAKARMQAELEAEWKSRLDAVSRLAESSAAEASRMEAIRIEMEKKDRDMAAVTAQLEHISGMLKEQRRRAETVTFASKEVVREDRVVLWKEVHSETVSVSPGVVAVTPPKAASPSEPAKPVERVLTPPPGGMSAAAVVAVPPVIVDAKPVERELTPPPGLSSSGGSSSILLASSESKPAKVKKRVSFSPLPQPLSAARAAAALRPESPTRPVPPAPVVTVSEQDVRDWIMTRGEKEPKGERRRILYKTLMQSCPNGETDYPSLALAVSLLRNKGSLVIASKTGGSSFDGSEIITYTPA